MRCEDQIFGQYGLTMEHYSVLAIMKLFDKPMRPTDLARWLERSPNSVSMLVDRMVKVGLVRRVRDKTDRRVVHVLITSKGEESLKPATLEGVKFIREIMSPLSQKDQSTLINLLELIKYKALEHLNPGISIEEMRENDITTHPELVKRLCRYISSSAPEEKSKRQDRKKGKTTK